jgi:hypothetical protein
MKKFYFTAAALMLAASLTTATESYAQNQVGVHVGANVDTQEIFRGAQGRLHVGNLPVRINPAFETYLVQDRTRYQGELNALVPIGMDTALFRPYAGAGVAVIHNAQTPAGSTQRVTDTALGLNLLAGASFGSGTLRPFAEGRFTVSDVSDVSVRGGVMFVF